MTKYLGSQEIKRFIPDPVGKVLMALCREGFFERSVLIGSWAMFYYRAIYNIPFAFLTSDIDMAVRVARKRDSRVDLEKVLLEVGATSDFSGDGLQRFIIPDYRIEFIVHEKRSRTRDSDIVWVEEWRIHAQPLPFIQMLLEFAERVDTDDFYVRIPIPEAFFFHKLIIAQRRQREEKKAKDLSQCTSLAGIINDEELQHVVRSGTFSAKTKVNIKKSCETIGFPFERLGI